VCTELAAFFRKRDHSHERPLIAKFYEGDDAITREELRKFYSAILRTAEDEKALPAYFGFERTNFGIIHVSSRKTCRLGEGGTQTAQKARD